VPFPRRLLTEGEELIVDARPHWIALAGPVLVTILLIVGVAFGLAKIDNSAGKLIVAGVALVLFVIYPVREFIRWITSHFVVTNERIIHRQGWIAKSSMEVPLPRINDVRFHQTIFERMVGAGDLILESAGERGQEVFSDIRNPENMQRTIYERARSREVGMGRMAAAPAAPAPPAASTTEELSRLADLRDRGVLTEEEFQAQKAKLLGQ
jgi:uncharacterized membrane protein YdbT with pleckstrin-like domain